VLFLFLNMGLDYREEGEQMQVDRFVRYLYVSLT